MIKYDRIYALFLSYFNFSVNLAQQVELALHGGYNEQRVWPEQINIYAIFHNNH